MLHLAVAATMCMPQPDLVAALAARFEERQIAVMMDDRGVAVQVFASDAGSWTMATLDGAGLACVVASGQRFMMVPPGEWN